MIALAFLAVGIGVWWLVAHGLGVLAVLGVAALALCLRASVGGGGAHGGGGDPWGVAVHEAAHVVAARQRGSASATLDHRRGHTRYDIQGSAVDEAVVLLAGGVAARRITGNACLAGSNDLAQARALLAGTGVSVAEAARRAERLVSTHRGKITTLAARGQRTGRI